MDKHSPKISIKVNGTETNYTEKQDKQQPVPILSQEEEEVVFPHIEPSYSNVVPFRGTPDEVQYEKKRPAGVQKRIIITVGTAILLGTGFGAAMLQMLGEGEPAQSVMKYTPVSTNVPEPAVKQEKAASPDSALSVKPIQAYVIQGGVFSTKDRAQGAGEELKKKGVPVSIRISDGKFYIFAAAASDEKTVKAIGELYKKNGVAPYVKTWNIEGREIPKKYEKQEELLVKIGGLLSGMLQQSSASFASAKGDVKEWERVKKEIETVKAEGKQVKQEDVKKLIIYTSLAYNSLKSYKDKPNPETFTKLQQFLLDGLASYESVLSAKENE
ncbi:MAG: hypothetical protein ACE3JP_08385 [Ectobacillus sp.]